MSIISSSFDDIYTHVHDFVNLPLGSMVYSISQFSFSDETCWFHDMDDIIVTLASGIVKKDVIVNNNDSKIMQSKYLEKYQMASMQQGCHT